MDLGFDITRIVEDLADPIGQVTIKRELNKADLELVKHGRGAPASDLNPPARVKKLRERHHALARCLAEGMTDLNASILTGYDPGYISILRSDPTFKNLVLEYRRQTEATWVDVQERLKTVSLTAAAELQDRLEEAPEKIPTSQLVEITKMGMDRTGHGPSSQNTQVNVNLNYASRVEAGRKRVSEHRDKVPQVIEGRAEEIDDAA